MPIEMSIASNRLRRRDRGIVLVTTLLLMMLLAGFAIAAQSRSLAQVRVLDKVRLVEQARVKSQSARALALPLVGEAMLDGREFSEIEVSFDDDLYVFELSETRRRNWYAFTVK